VNAAAGGREARLVKQKSDSPCIEGQTWGSGATGCGSTAAAVRSSKSCSAAAGLASGSIAARSSSDIASARYSVATRASSSATTQAASAGAPGMGHAGWAHLGQSRCKDDLNSYGRAAVPVAEATRPAAEAEVQCRNQAAREGVSVRSIEPAVLRVRTGRRPSTARKATRASGDLRFYPAESCGTFLSERPWRRLERGG